MDVLCHQHHQRYTHSAFACFERCWVHFHRILPQDGHRMRSRKAATRVWVRWKASTTQNLLSWSHATLRMCAETWATRLLHAKSQQKWIWMRSWQWGTSAASDGEWCNREHPFGVEGCHLVRNHRGTSLFYTSHVCKMEAERLRLRAAHRRASWSIARFLEKGLKQSIA